MTIDERIQELEAKLKASEERASKLEFEWLRTGGHLDAANMLNVDLKAQIETLKTSLGKAHADIEHERKMHAATYGRLQTVSAMAHAMIDAAGVDR